MDGDIPYQPVQGRFPVVVEADLPRGGQRQGDERDMTKHAVQHVRHRRRRPIVDRWYTATSI